ncbi:MAG: DMT family transporter [Betaproteobacteria bacterium]|jgi:drug/metabolite transporter (DMT)-like permease|nr:DMT family transporter [Betaproteobacteria bacterium]
MSPLAPSSTQHKIGIATMILCASLWSIAGLLMRASSVTNGWEASFWRSAFLAAAVGAFLLARNGRNVHARILAMGWPGLVSGLAWATMFTCFMLALSLTTVANTLFIMGLLPFCAALAGWIVLGERVPLRTWVAMAAATAGIGIMFHGAFRTGNLNGSLIALGVPFAAAVNYVAVKLGRGRVDLIPALVLGGALSALIALPLALPITADGTDLSLFGALAVFQLAIPGVLYTVVAVPRLSAAEVGLLSLIEVILGPLWVWLARGEEPGTAVLTGGIIVITALAVNESVGLAIERRALRRAAIAR